jgi:hypothetical protein
MARRETDRKRDAPVCAADASVWAEFLRWRQRARDILQEHERLSAERNGMDELGKTAGQKYQDLLAEWTERVDADTGKPRASCPRQPPQLFLDSLPQQERPLFERDYQRWHKGAFARSPSGRKTMQPASEAFRRWLAFPTWPVSTFVPEQLRIEEWYQAIRELDNSAQEMCQKFRAQSGALKHSIPFIGARKSTRNEAAAASAQKSLDQAMALIGSGRSSGSDLLRQLASHADEIVNVLWRSEYGGLLSRTLATGLFAQELSGGRLSTESQHGQLQRKLVQLLDRHGIPVPQQAVYAAPTWTQAFDAGQGIESLKSFLSTCWSDARMRIHENRTHPG